MAVEDQAPSGVDHPGGDDGHPDHYVIAGEHHPMITESRCRACRHPGRSDIDTWLLNGVPASVVVDRLGDGAPSRASIGRHAQRHLPRELVARQALVAEQARDGVALDDQVAEVLDARAMARLLAQSATQALRDGRIVPLTFSDVTKAVDLLVKTEALGETDHDEELRLLRLAHIRFVEVAQRHAPPEVWEAIGADMRTDRVLAASIDRSLGTETAESAALLDRELAALPPT